MLRYRRFSLTALYVSYGGVTTCFRLMDPPSCKSTYASGLELALGYSFYELVIAKKNTRVVSECFPVREFYHLKIRPSIPN